MAFGGTKISLASICNNAKGADILLRFVNTSSEFIDISKILVFGTFETNATLSEGAFSQSTTTSFDMLTETSSTIQSPVISISPTSVWTATTNVYDAVTD